MSCVKRAQQVSQLTIPVINVFHSTTIELTTVGILIATMTKAPNYIVVVFVGTFWLLLSGDHIHKKQPMLKCPKMDIVNIPHEQRRTENEKTRSIFARIA